MPRLGTETARRSQLFSAVMALCVLALVIAASAFAAAGQLDSGFSEDGKRTFGFPNSGDPVFHVAEGVAVQSGGKIVVAGHSSGDFAVARLNGDGSLDQTFSDDGKRTFGFADTNDFATGLAIQNGKIVVAGYSFVGAPLQADFAIARLNPDGSFDQTFSSDGKRTFGFANQNGTDQASGVTLQGDKIVVAGYSNQGTASQLDFAVARLNHGGSLDASFSEDGKRTFGFVNADSEDVAYDVAIQGGKIVVAGRSHQVATSGDFAVARLNAGGSLDQSFSEDGKRTFGFGNGFEIDQANGVAIRGEKIVVAGYSPQDGTGDDFAVARLNSSGGLDDPFSDDGKRTFPFAGGSGDDRGNAIAIQSDGKIVVAGEAVADFAVARLGPGGGLDQAFSEDGKRMLGFATGGASAAGFVNPGTDAANAVAIQGGTIVVAGTSAQSSTTVHVAVARLLGD